MPLNPHFTDFALGDDDGLALTKPCDHAGCAEVGAYRAPKARDRLQDYYWFCLNHVRDYNARWNYYAGMNEAAIEAHLRADACWQRETWPLGGGKNGGNPVHDRTVRDHVVRDYYAEAAPQREAPNYAATAAALPPEIMTAFTVLELMPPCDATQMKAQYRLMVKRHHPDANGGSPDAAERFKQINQAYSLLREWLEQIVGG